MRKYEDVFKSDYAHNFRSFLIRKGYPAQRPLSIKSITCGRAEKVFFFVLSDKRGTLRR